MGMPVNLPSLNEVFPWLASRYVRTGPQLSNGITLFQNWVLDYVYKFINSSANVAKLRSDGMLKDIPTCEDG
jgi:hypothetical protein